MKFVDRFFKNRRIVAKVVLILIPLIALIAGVGALGYTTAKTLNGHMTTTRAMIGNIKDFEDLQSALQEFITRPSDQSRSAFAAALAAQADGVSRLEGDFAQDRVRVELANVTDVAAKLSEKEAELWGIFTQERENDALLHRAVSDVSIAVSVALSEAGKAREEFRTKESFAKELLYDASVYKAFSSLLGTMRSDFQMAFTPDEQIEIAETAHEALEKQIVASREIASSAATSLIDEIAQSSATLKMVLQSDSADDQKIKALAPILSGLVLIESKMVLQSDKSNSAAADRFVTLDKSIDGLRDRLAAAEDLGVVFDRLKINVARMMSVRSPEYQQAVLSDLEGLNRQAVVLSKSSGPEDAIGNAVSVIPALADDIVMRSSKMSTIAKRWSDVTAESKDVLAVSMNELRDFVTSAQEDGKSDSERSGFVSVAVMIGGTLLACVGAIFLIEALRAPLNGVTSTMSLLAGGDLNVDIHGSERQDEVGDMVRATIVFRDAARENARLEEEAAAARSLAAEEASRRSYEMGVRTRFAENRTLRSNEA